MILWYVNYTLIKWIRKIKFKNEVTPPPSGLPSHNSCAESAAMQKPRGGGKNQLWGARSRCHTEYVGFTQLQLARAHWAPPGATYTSLISLALPVFSLTQPSRRGAELCTRCTTNFVSFNPHCHPNKVSSTIIPFSGREQSSTARKWGS